MFKTKAVGNIQTHILCSSNSFSRKHSGAGQTADDNTIQRMRFACWITKATNTHQEMFRFHSFVWPSLAIVACLQTEQRRKKADTKLENTCFFFFFFFVFCFFLWGACSNTFAYVVHFPWFIEDNWPKMNQSSPQSTSFNLQCLHRLLLVIHPK
jgi:hypothetical protein